MPRTDDSERLSSRVSSNALGTFGGVFTPSILTIPGVIMFMRTGFVVGQVGIFNALLILVLAKGITTMTGALACIATAVLIDPQAACLAAVVVGIFYAVLRRKVLRVRFGQGRSDGLSGVRLNPGHWELSRIRNHTKNMHVPPIVRWVFHHPGDNPSIARYGRPAGSSSVTFRNRGATP